MLRWRVLTDPKDIELRDASLACISSGLHGTPVTGEQAELVRHHVWVLDILTALD